MSTRRAHTKTRTGCIRCKQKHLKCDEARPSCGACTRYQVPCVVKIDQNRVTPSTTTTQIALNSPSNLSNSSPQGQSPGIGQNGTPAAAVMLTGHSESQRQSLTMWEFDLLHHYITKVTESFLAPPFVQEFLSREAVTLATRHDFLFHVTLMTSCLHLALTKSPLFTQAHQDFISGGCSSAMEKFRREAENINESNWQAVRPFAFLLAIYTLSLPLLDAAPKSPDTVLDDMIKALSLLRGVRIFASLTDGLDAESEDSRDENKGLGSYMPNFQEEFDIDRIVPSLIAQVRESGDDIQTRHVNLNAIDGLRKASDSNFMLSLRPIIWPCTLEQDFCILLEQRNPSAMVILAHYAVILDQCKSCWWCADLGSRLIVAVRALLPPEVHKAIVYPLEKVNSKQT